MKRLIIILIPVTLSFVFGIYTGCAVSKQNQMLQAEIKSLLQSENIRPEQADALADQCESLVNGLGMVLNDDRTADVADHTQKLRYAAAQNDRERIHEALFSLSGALEELAKSEQVSLQSLLCRRHR